MGLMELLELESADLFEEAYNELTAEDARRLRNLFRDLEHALLNTEMRSGHGVYLERPFYNGTRINLIRTVKLIRDVSDIGLREATNIVRRLELGGPREFICLERNARLDNREAQLALVDGVLRIKPPVT